MNPADDAWRLSTREAALSDDVKRRDSDPTLGLSHLLSRTTTVTAYPTSAQSFFACQPVTLLGAEVEGGAGAVTPTLATFFAFNLGSGIPPAGTQVLTSFVGNRWVFRFDS